MNRELCEECIERDDCQLRKERTHSITTCDEYKSVAEEAKFAEAAATRGEGLCATCAIRKNCPRGETEGGVWRCPDYR